VCEQDLSASLSERHRLLAANEVTANFFRRELMRASGGWPVEYPKVNGIEHVFSSSSTWKIGYAPLPGTRLAQHFAEAGFTQVEMVTAGLVEWTEEGHAVDKHSDLLVLAVRDRHRSPARCHSAGRYRPDGGDGDLAGKP
jgi:DNA primase